jgi:heavy metal sensor kinase
MSLRARLVLWYTAVFGVSGGVLVVALHSLIAHKLRGEADTFLEDEYNELVAATLDVLGRRARAEEAARTRVRLWEAVRGEIENDKLFELTYRLHDTATRQDVVFLTADKRHRAVLKGPPIDAQPRERAFSSVHVPERRYPYRVLTGPLDPESHPHLVLQVAVYAKRLSKRTASLRKYLIVILLSVVVLAALGGWFLAVRSLKPIDQMAAELSHIESSSLGQRLEVGSAGDEIDRIRQAVNRMLERLERAFEGLRSFTADAAHELRTPLAALRCRLEVAINKPRSPDDEHIALSEVLEQVAELSTLVENLLLLARMDAEDQLPAAAPVDVEELLGQVAEPFGMLAEQKGVHLALECDAPGRVGGDAVLLRRLFGNLLDNAIRHTPPGGCVTVRAKRLGGACCVDVGDTGAGIEPEALEHIFDRFYRADEARSRSDGGAGLGLSIVKRIVELHRGTVRVESQPGRGTTVHVSLPCQETAATSEAQKNLSGS